MPADPKQIRDVFLAVTELPVTERAAYLQEHCQGNDELRAAVERLLAAHEQPASVLQQPAPGMPTADFPGISERPGTKIGPYKLMEKIGEGGFGLVFVAEQTEPVKRKVALKVIKPGMDSKQVIARFEAERQALAMMDHPNIARVLDAGTTETGRPYFVMELVRGIPITEYCDQNHLTPDERLALFVDVCHAIQHAHHKGVIHRDIKPSNVLVTSHDGKPVPKVIDFGVAKAIHQHLTERTLYTNFAQMIGTPLYMSPEQAEMSGLDIDTRSDIYSLGVLLYELLTGSTPLERKRLAQAAFDEIRRVIREEEPPRPSDRLSTSETLPSLAANRRTEPARLSRMLKGELDWIVMKALEKDRTRRYETANGLSRDIQRYLNDEVVEARPASAGYRMKKFVKRNKGKVLAAGLVFGALLAGVAVSTWQAVRATRAERLALEARQAEVERAEGERLARIEAQQKTALAVAAAASEKAARLKADQGRKYAEAVIKFVRDDFLALTSVGGQARFTGEDLPVELNSNMTLRQMLDRAAAKLEQRKDLAPTTEADLRWIIGLSYGWQGEYKLGIRHLERAAVLMQEEKGINDVGTLGALHTLASGYLHTGRLSEAIKLYEQLRDIRVAKLGNDDPITLSELKSLADGYLAVGRLSEAIKLYEQVRETQVVKLGPDDRKTLHTCNNLAIAYREAGRVPEAIKLLEQVRDAWAAKGAKHPDSFSTLTSLGNTYQEAGRLSEAIKLLKQARDGMLALLGSEHPDTMLTTAALAQAYVAVGRAPEAIKLLEEPLRLMKAKLGPDDLITLSCMQSLGMAFTEAGKLDKALPLLEETLRLTKAKLGADHPRTLERMHDLAMTLTVAGNLDKALPLLEETLRLTKAKLGPDHPRILLSINNLAGGYWSANQLDKSIPLFEEAVSGLEKKFGRKHPQTLRTVANLGVNYRDAGRIAEALPLLEEAHRAVGKHPALRWVSMELLSAYADAGKTNEVLTLTNYLVAEARQSLPKESPPLAGQLATICLSLNRSKAFVEAEPLLREALEIRQVKEPDAWRTFNTMSMLGHALLGQKKYTEAEPLLVKGYDGVKQRENTIPPQGKNHLASALDRLIQFYTETNKPDEVKKWQAEKEKLPKSQVNR